MPQSKTGQEQLAEMDRVYEQYGRPLERDHWGEYLAVSQNGETLLARSLEDAVGQAADRFGSDNFVFKIGEKVVGKWLYHARAGNANRGGALT